MLHWQFNIKILFKGLKICFKTLDLYSLYIIITLLQIIHTNREKIKDILKPTNDSLI
jgi:hypothetical protein